MDMQIFSSPEGQEIRVVDREGEPWFVASDVAKALGYRDAHNLTRRLDEEDRGTRSVSTPSGAQEMTIISEPGLYAAILGSEAEGAKAFRRWIAGDVLPSIRKTGAPPFDALRRTREDGSEYWSARDLQGLLGYEKWQKFEGTIERAQQAARNMGGERVEEHLTGAGKVIEHGKGSMQLAKDYHLSRYGAYLVAMNGDPRKPEIAAAQHYFAVRTREAELGAKPQPHDYLSMSPAELVALAGTMSRKACALHDLADALCRLSDQPCPTVPSTSGRGGAVVGQGLASQVSSWVSEFLLPGKDGAISTTTEEVLSGIGQPNTRANQCSVGEILRGLGFARTRRLASGSRRYLYTR